MKLKLKPTINNINHIIQLVHSIKMIRIKKKTQNEYFHYGYKSYYVRCINTDNQSPVDFAHYHSIRKTRCCAAVITKSTKGHVTIVILNSDPVLQRRKEGIRGSIVFQHLDVLDRSIQDISIILSYKYSIIIIILSTPDQNT